MGSSGGSDAGRLKELLRPGQRASISFPSVSCTAHSNFSLPPERFSNLYNQWSGHCRQMPFLLAEQKNRWKDTHIGPVLPERAPSEGPRSTTARRPTHMPFQERRSKYARKNHFRSVERFPVHFLCPWTRVGLPPLFHPHRDTSATDYSTRTKSIVPPSYWRSRSPTCPPAQSITRPPRVSSLAPLRPLC
jgi:hypothetical protein